MMLSDAAHTGQRRAILHELRHRPPQPRLLVVLDTLPPAELRELGGSVVTLVRRLGVQALSTARSWAASTGHPLIWAAYLVLAEHGDAADVPALLNAVAWLDSRPRDWCGYDRIVTGLARIGGSATGAVVPRLRSLWFTPHSHERPAYLRALIALGPREDAQRLLHEGLWDCEAAVRLLAAQRAPLTTLTETRLGHLRDDPIETPQIRAAAAARLA